MLSIASDMMNAVEVKTRPLRRGGFTTDRGGDDDGGGVDHCCIAAVVVDRMLAIGVHVVEVRWQHG